jgi:hypothetical protein
MMRLSGFLRKIVVGVMLGCVLNVNRDDMPHSSRADERSDRLMRVLALLARVPDPAAAGETSSRGDGLTVEFDDAYTAFVDGFEDLPSESQMAALQAVDRKLSMMVSAKDPDLWTPRARREAPSWSEVRQLAGTVIREFAWSTELDEPAIGALAAADPASR